MKQTDVITNETEFQEWLASAFDSERQRLREEAAARETEGRRIFEVLEKNTTKETQHHEDQR